VNDGDAKGTALVKLVKLSDRLWVTEDRSIEVNLHVTSHAPMIRGLSGVKVRNYEAWRRGADGRGVKVARATSQHGIRYAITRFLAEEAAAREGVGGGSPP